VRKVALGDRAEAEEPWLVGLRDRALMAVMTYTFARGSAVECETGRPSFHGRFGEIKLTIPRAGWPAARDFAPSARNSGAY